MLKSNHKLRQYTTAKGLKDKLAEQAPILLVEDSEPGLPFVLIDPDKRFQTMEGFGGAFTEAAADSLYRMGEESKKRLFKAYFDRTEGHGYTFCRTHIGSCDFSLDNYSYATIAGDVDLGITWTGEAFTAQQENPAFKYVYPKEGAILWQDNWAIPTDASHLDAAYAWISYTSQGNMFWLMLRDFTYINPNQAALDYAKTNQADLYNAYINSTITNVPLDAIANGHRIEDVGDATPLYDQIWTEVKGGQ